MNSIASVISSHNNTKSSTIGTIGASNSKPIVTIVRQQDVKLSAAEVKGCDLGLSQFKDLMHPDFYAWYCKAWYKLGREKFIVLASQARSDGKNPPKLFSHLIKKALREC